MYIILETITVSVSGNVTRLTVDNIIPTGPKIRINVLKYGLYPLYVSKIEVTKNNIKPIIVISCIKPKFTIKSKKPIMANNIPIIPKIDNIFSIFINNLLNFPIFKCLHNVG